MIQTVITCDSCSREEALAPGANQLDSWSVLSTAGRKWDVCPSCTAQLGGWKPELKPA